MQSVITAFGLLVLLSGCSNEQIYTAVQENRRFECQQYPDKRYQDCMAEHQRSYQQYQQAREQLESPEQSDQ